MFEGLWKLNVATPMGEQDFDLQIGPTVGDAFAGNIDGAFGQHEFQGRVDGNRLTWAVTITEPVKLTLNYEVEITGDTLKGSTKLGFIGTAPLTGYRVSTGEPS